MYYNIYICDAEFFLHRWKTKLVSGLVEGRIDVLV